MLATNSQEEIILIADSRIIAIPIKENSDPLVNMTEQKGIVYGPSPEIPNNTDYTKMRRSVFEKLLQAQTLLPKGLSFCLYEGYRSLNLQKMLYENRSKLIQGLYPLWDKDAVFDETIKMVSPIVNKDGSQNVPPHSTGAAVDVYLLDQDGNAIDMGIHPEDWMKDEDGSISVTNSSRITTEAQKNRAIMSHVLTQVGFINYPTEYWHWSYGDRYWAYFKNQPYAHYGTIKDNS
jgi:D-alanyl-D-alanine dipeptidase